MKTIIIGVGIIALLFFCLVLAIKYAAKKSDEAETNRKIADACRGNQELYRKGSGRNCKER